MIRLKVDVAIIGGGIIGLACAYHLHRQGLTVAVADKGSFSTEQSRRNSGFIRQQGRDPRELELIRRSLELWERIPAETGMDIGFARRGNLAVTNSPDKIAAMREWIGVAAEHGIHSQLLGPDELRELVPNLSARFLGGLYTASDCQGEPFLAGASIARFLAASGVHLLDHCHVRELLTENGRVCGILAECGEIRADQVILAAGLWSAAFLERHGVRLPVADLRISVGRTAPFDHGLTVPVWTPRVLLRPRQDGGLTVALGQNGPADHDVTWQQIRQGLRFLPNYLANRKSVRVNLFGRHRHNRRYRRAYRGGNPAELAEIRTEPVVPNTHELARCVAAASEEFAFGHPTSLIESWACRADMTPDGIPIIGPLPDLPGMMLVTGMNGHGFGISMGVGEAVALALARGALPEVLKPFDFSRFTRRYFHKPMNVL